MRTARAYRLCSLCSFAKLGVPLREMQIATTLHTKLSMSPSCELLVLRTNPAKSFVVTPLLFVEWLGGVLPKGVHLIS